MNILILGTSGYVGSHIKYYFTENKNINIFELNRNTNLKSNNVFFDYIFICIGDKSTRISEEQMLISKKLEIGFIKKIQELKYGKIIYISSILVGFVNNNYTNKKIIIEKFLKENFTNLVILRVSNLFGNVKDGSLGDDFKNGLNIASSLFIYSKKIKREMTIEKSFLKYKREYIDINIFSEYFTNTETLKNLKSKTYTVGTGKPVSGDFFLSKISNSFNFNLSRVSYENSIFVSIDIETKDILLDDINFDNIYSQYNSRLDFLNKKLL